MSQAELLPALRAVDVSPFRGEDGELRFAISDNSGIATGSLAVSLPGYFVLMHLDGGHTLDDVERAFIRQFQQRPPLDQIRGLIESLDRALLLQNDRFEQSYADRRDAYLRGDARDGRHRWGPPEELRAQLTGLLGDAPAADAVPLRGIVAPHLDYPRGRPCYATAYGALARGGRAERYVLLGTNHFGRARGVVATGKDFLTPLGRAPTDRAMLERIERRIGASLRTHEFDHAAEHSVELQVHLLQRLHGDEPFQIVPVLCPDPSTPAEDEVPLAAFCDALRDELASSDRPTTLIAGADLSHVGQRFGDTAPTTAEFLEQVNRSDRALLELLVQRRDEEFVENVRATANATRICSVGCIYALVRALPDADFRLLDYHMAIDLDAETHVSCAAAVLV